MVVSNTLVGMLCAIGSAFFNGSFTVPFKIKGKDENESSIEEPSTSLSNSIIHPIVFTLYVSIGVSLSSWFFIPFLNNSILSFASVVAGWLFVLGVAASFLAIDLIGMALSQGIWAGSATVVSYFWGTVIFGEIPSSLAASLIGLVILIIGVVGIIFADSIPKVRIFNRTLFLEDYDYENLGTVVENEVGRDQQQYSNSNNKASSYWYGVSLASLVGIFGGSILAPTHYIPPESQGLAVLPSFGIGTITLSPTLFIIYIWWTQKVPPLKLQKAFFPGLFSGLIWNISNVMSLIAIPIIGYGVAYPLLQSAVLVSGLWGIYVFGEISNRATIRAFWCSSIVLLIGAAILAASQ